MQRSTSREPCVLGLYARPRELRAQATHPEDRDKGGGSEGGHTHGKLAEERTPRTWTPIADAAEPPHHIRQTRAGARRTRARKRHFRQARLRGAKVERAAARVPATTRILRAVRAGEGAM